MNAAAVLLLIGNLTGPSPEPELLPLPKLATPPAPQRVQPIVLPPLGFYQPDPYAVWQLYSVDQFGKMRARVVDSSVGAYYLYNGEPYPYGNLYPRNWKP